MKIILTKREIKKGKKEAKNRTLLGLTINKGKFYKKDWGFQGSHKNIDIQGALAELAFSKAFKLKWDRTTWGGRYDVGKFQVRSTKHLNGCLLIRKNDEDEDNYVLVIDQCPKFEIIGWLRGKDAKKNKWIRIPNNRPPAWFVPQEYLNKFD